MAPSRRSSASTLSVDSPRARPRRRRRSPPACQRSTRARVASRYSPPNAAVSEPLRRTRAGQRARSREGREHQQVPLPPARVPVAAETIAIIASASSTRPGHRERHGPPRSLELRSVATRHRRTARPRRRDSTSESPAPSPAGGGPSSGGSPASETTAQPIISATSPPSRARGGEGHVARGPASGADRRGGEHRRDHEPDRGRDANPTFGALSRTPGVASACRPRNPALARNASETRISRASRYRPAATFVTYASDDVDDGRDRGRARSGWDGAPSRCRARGGRGAGRARRAG